MKGKPFTRCAPRCTPGEFVDFPLNPPKMGFWEIVIFLIKWPPDAPKDAVFFTFCDKNRFLTKKIFFHDMPQETISDLPDHVNTRFETFYPNVGLMLGFNPDQPKMAMLAIGHH